MTVKPIAEAAAEAKPYNDEQFAPANYPYGYAVDLLVGWHQIIPVDLLGAKERERLDSGYPLKRDTALGILNQWADATGIPPVVAAVTLADRFIELEGIEVPQRAVGLHLFDPVAAGLNAAAKETSR